MRIKRNFANNTALGMTAIWKQTDFRNNVILLFSLYYGVYFGFFIGLPMILNVSYVLASGWLVVLALAGLLAAVKTMMVVFYELKKLTSWSMFKIKDSVHSPRWEMPSWR